MKKIVIIALVTLTAACQLEDLKLVNPNAPGLASVRSEQGLKAFAMGIYEKAYGWEVDGWLLPALSYHSITGDEVYIPWNNWQWAFLQRYFLIRLPDGREFQHPLSPGQSQRDILKNFNTRERGAQFANPLLWEWAGAYVTIGQAHELMAILDAPETSGVAISGNRDIKFKTLRAWALWWKGFMYSRVGSQYLSGLIVDQAGKTNGDYKDRSVIIESAASNFDEAIAILTTIAEDDPDYNDIMNAIVPEFNNSAAIVSPQMWIRLMNTYKARNILVNTRQSDLTISEWTKILQLSENGLRKSDHVFTLGMTINGINDLTWGFHPYLFANDEIGTSYASERLIQEFKPGDARFTRNFHALPLPTVNDRNRGWLFGTRYGHINIEDGGGFATATNQGQLPIATTYEENELMLAESKIFTGDIEGGLSHVDAVRTHQTAALASVAGTGLTQAEALEELRRERRVALYMRGLAFYDARRWGLLAPAAQGGGRTGAMVMIPANIYDPENDRKPDVYPCFIEYDYMEYWDVPANELDYNKANVGSAMVKG